MEDAMFSDSARVAAQLREQALADQVRATLHGHREMVAEDISYKDLREILLECQVIENYPHHQRGPCCLICGRTSSGRFLHVVCTTGQDVAIIITVYEPKAPKWVTPFERGGRDEV